MTFEEMVEFAMERLDPAQPERRATRDKVRKRIRGGLGDGKLPRLDLQTMDVDRHAFIYWARTKWPGKFNIPISVPGALSDTARLAASADGALLPTDIATCHALLRQQRWLLQMLDARSRAQDQIIADLRPDAERYRQIREKNRKSARKPRRESGSWYGPLG